MKIRPKNILKFLYGGTPLWYLDRYKYHGLKGWNSNLNNNLATQLLKDHSNASNLDTAYTKNYYYTGTPGAVESDIQSFYDSDGKNLTAELFVKLYNDNASKIRNFWDTERAYNNIDSDEVRLHNQLFRKMFKSRSTESTVLSNAYDIGYLTDVEGRLGSNTWLRRMDRYETKFDPNNPDKNRIHSIKLGDGTIVQVYKKSDGDIELFNPATDTSKLNVPPVDTISPELEQRPGVTETGTNPVEINTGTKSDGTGGSDVPQGKKDPGINWKEVFKNVGEGLQKQLPNILEDVRLAGNLIANDRIYNEALKGIRPNLHLTYNTYRQVVGDEATKQAYYNRAAAGLTAANITRTSDMDKQMAYSMEARALADKLRAEGDLADNLRIRETSELSSQHADANRQRATQIANENIDLINAANQAKHNLLSLKYAANWTSWDNFLKGRVSLYRQRIAEEKAIDDLIQALVRSGMIENDGDLKKLQEQLEAASKKPENLKSYGGYVVVDHSQPEIKKIEDQIREKLKLLAIDFLIMLKRGIFTAKSGAKITRKNKEDLLYKSTRDAVEHFRKMTKLTDNSYLKSRKKTPKLVPHPTKKLQQGGVAPFVVYTPTVTGGETTTTATTSSSKSSSSAKEDKDKQLLDLVSKLFSQVDGLPVDVGIIYGPIMELLDRVRYGGKELSSSDIATLYLQSIQLLSYVKYHKQAFEEARAEAVKNNSINDFAIAPGGMFIVLNLNTKKLEVRKWGDIDRDSEIPLTNLLLLNMRAVNPDQAFNSYYVNIVQGNVGIDKVTELIKLLADSIGTTELENQGYSKKDSINITEGMRQLLKEGPDNVYKISTTSKTQLLQIDAALKYIMHSLPNNMASTLQAYSDMRGVTPELLVMYGLSSRQNITLENEVSKAEGSEDSLDKLTSNPLVAMLREVGGTPTRYNLITRDSNTRIAVNGTKYSSLPNVDDNMSIDKMLSESKIDGMLAGNKYSITFGDLQINPSYLKDIMYYNSGDNVIVTLPCKIVNGLKQVNLGVIDSYNEAEQEALKKSGGDRHSKEYQILLGKELQAKHLDSLLDSNGLPNEEMFGQFLIVQAYTTDRVPLDKNSLYIEKVRNPDENLERMISEALSTDTKKSNYSIDVDDNWLEFGWDDVYRGTVFIPITNNILSAMNSWGTNVQMGQQKDLEELYQIANKRTRYNPDTSLN